MKKTIFLLLISATSLFAQSTKRDSSIVGKRPQVDRVFRPDLFNDKSAKGDSIRAFYRSRPVLSDSTQVVNGDTIIRFKGSDKFVPLNDVPFTITRRQWRNVIQSIQVLQGKIKK